MEKCVKYYIIMPIIDGKYSDIMINTRIFSNVHIFLQIKHVSHMINHMLMIYIQCHLFPYGARPTLILPAVIICCI